MEVQIVELSGKALTLQVEASDTIRALKGKIREAVSLPKDQTLQLIFEGQSLANGETLSTCNVQSGLYAAGGVPDTQKPYRFL